MTNAVNKTVRLRHDVVDAATARADELGITFTNLVESALRHFLDLGGNAPFELLEKVRDHLIALYPDRRGFPRDVTLEVFRAIRDDQDLWRLYVAATRDPDGEIETSARDSLHRRIGRTVKVVLGARVVGRSLLLDPEVELISSHALLEPGDG